ncbi:MAG: polysaccharide lyase family 7 protein [Thalassotalea sp.]
MKALPSKLYLLLAMGLIGCGATTANTSDAPKQKNKTPVIPADKFDLSHWKITLPLDANDDGKIDEVSVRRIQRYQHPDFFYLNADQEMVFTVPNKAKTTSGSSNTRSELRQMIRGKDKKLKTHSPENNFGLKVNDNSVHVGGKLNATLSVDHVSKRAGHVNKRPAYSVVVGQIHATKDKTIVAQGDGFGWGNEPIKIYYKKWPNHDKGSVFWNYERNLEKENPNRTDIAYPVWGNTWENPADPGVQGIALGESFSYEINVHENIMYLTFETANQKTVNYQIDLSNNVDANGKVDNKDHPQGYTGDMLYFKAGAYNQCSTKDSGGDWYTACPGTGVWATDKANGDYTSVAFSKLTLSQSTPPK